MGNVQLRKQRITPLQNALLRILEEAGSETLPILATMSAAQFPDIEPAIFIWELQEAIYGLLRLGWIAIRSDYRRMNAPLLPLSEALNLLLPELLIWDDNAQLWRWQGGKERSGEFEVVLTDNGKEAMSR